MQLVMINGLPGCLKTTLSYHLAPALSMGHVSTSSFGSFTSDRSSNYFMPQREIRYRAAFDLANKFMELGVSVVLDGTFALRTWRDEVYHLAKRHSASEVVAITCTCSRPEILRERFEFRKQFPSSPDSFAGELSAFIGGAYEFETLDFEVLNDPSRSLIELDSCTYRVIPKKISGPFAEEVLATLHKLLQSGRLDNAFFSIGPATKNSPPKNARLLVALEGIGGSGKTTQSRRLIRNLRRLFPERVINLYGEFSGSNLGYFIRTKLQEVPQIHRQILVIADGIKKSSLICQDHTWEIAIADRYIWTHLAHAMALQSTSPSELEYSVRDALTTITEKFPKVLAIESVIFLDIPPELAIKRIRNRDDNISNKIDLPMLQRLSSAYKEIIDHHKNAYVVDGSKSEEETEKSILSHISIILEAIYKC